MTSRNILQARLLTDLESFGTALLVAAIPLASLLVLGGVDLATPRGRQAFVAAALTAAAVAITVPILRRERAESDDGRIAGAMVRRELDRALAYEGPRSLRQRLPVSLLTLDLGTLPSGRPVDRHLLVRVSSVLREATREDMDRVFPCGPRELYILLPGTDTAGAAIVADRIIERLHTGSLELVGERLLCSIGVAGFDRERPERWLQRSIAATETAARRGGGMEIASLEG